MHISHIRKLPALVSDLLYMIVYVSPACYGHVDALASIWFLAIQTDEWSVHHIHIHITCTCTCTVVVHILFDLVSCRKYLTSVSESVWVIQGLSWPRESRQVTIFIRIQSLWYFKVCAQSTGHLWDISGRVHVHVHVHLEWWLGTGAQVGIVSVKKLKFKRLYFA